MKITTALGTAVLLVKSFVVFLGNYQKRHILTFAHIFEKRKNTLVKFLLMKRGRYNRHFLHTATLAVFTIGVLIAPILADSYPAITQQATLATRIAQAAPQEQSISVDNNIFQTEISQKPRDKVITYTAEKGDTLSTIGEKFGVSTDTIKWSNDLTNDNVTVGDELKILPVTGIQHKVQKGDTISSIAKKYNTEAQKIADFPFNDFANPETFALVEGQMLVVPDGIKPSEQPFIKRQTYLANGPIPVSGGGFTFPMRGEISQFFSWYHPGLDIATAYGTPVVAAHNGTVTKVFVGGWDGGYGTNLYVDNGAGVESHYAHLSGVNVSVGQQVVGGSTVIGFEGSTGRSTGPHLHFEIRVNGTAVNPLSYVQ